MARRAAFRIRSGGGLAAVGGVAGRCGRLFMGVAVDILRFFINKLRPKSLFFEMLQGNRVDNRTIIKEWRNERRDSGPNAQETRNCDKASCPRESIAPLSLHQSGDAVLLPGAGADEDRQAASRRYFVAVALADADTRMGPQQRGVNPSVISRIDGLAAGIACARLGSAACGIDLGFSKGGDGIRILRCH